MVMMKSFGLFCCLMEILCSIWRKSKWDFAWHTLKAIRGGMGGYVDGNPSIYICYKILILIAHIWYYNDTILIPNVLGAWLSKIHMSTTPTHTNPIFKNNATIRGIQQRFQQEPHLELLPPQKKAKLSVPILFYLRSTSFGLSRVLILLFTNCK
jgi:hypothetical protein